MRTPGRLAFLVTAVASLGSDCGGWDPGSADVAWETPPPAVMIAGDWIVTGDGTRSDCDDENYDGRFHFQTAQALTVTQAPGATSETATLSLARAPETPAGVEFGFSGDVASLDVSFTIAEKSADAPYQAVTLRFVGTANTEGTRIEGSVGGEGPYGCANDGSFTVTVR